MWGCGVEGGAGECLIPSTIQRYFVFFIRKYILVTEVHTSLRLRASSMKSLGEPKLRTVGIVSTEIGYSNQTIQACVTLLYQSVDVRCEGVLQIMNKIIYAILRLVFNPTIGAKETV